MKKVIILSLLAASLAAPVFADDTQQDIQSEKNAIHKDDMAIAKDKAALAKDRAKEAADKANGNYGKEAEDNMAIGTDKSEIEGNKVDKSADQKMLQHHEDEMNNSTSN